MGAFPPGHVVLPRCPRRFKAGQGRDAVVQGVQGRADRPGWPCGVDVEFGLALVVVLDGPEGGAEVSDSQGALDPGRLLDVGGLGSVGGAWSVGSSSAAACRAWAWGVHSPACVGAGRR